MDENKIEDQELDEAVVNQPTTEAVPTKISFSGSTSPVVETIDVAVKPLTKKELKKMKKNGTPLTPEEIAKARINKNYGDRKKPFIAGCILFAIMIVAAVVMGIFSKAIIESVLSVGSGKSGAEAIALIFYYIFFFPILLCMLVAAFSPVFGCAIACVVLFAGSCKSTKKSYKVFSIILLVLSCLVLLVATGYMLIMMFASIK